MPEFELICWIDNVTPPSAPLSIAGVTVERPPYTHTLDDPTVQRVAKAGGLLSRQTVELRQAVEIRRRMTVECQMRTRGNAANEQAALDLLLPRVQNFIMTIQILTTRAVELTGLVVGIPEGGTFFPVAYKKKYRGGPATIPSLPVLKELMDVLDGSFPKRIETALVEFDTALKSEDVRRQFIHSVVVLEGLFGDASTEALSYKVPLRAVQLVPSLASDKKKGFETIRSAYSLRSNFVHGTWSAKTLEQADDQIERILQLTGEALQEFLFRVRDGKAVDFPALDEELLLK